MEIGEQNITEEPERNPELFLANQRKYLDSIGFPELSLKDIQEIRVKMEETNAMIDKHRPKDYKYTD